MLGAVEFVRDDGEFMLNRGLVTLEGNSRGSKHLQLDKSDYHKTVEINYGR